MMRRQAEAEAGRRNADAAFTSERRSYRAERSLAAESEWSVVTYRDDKAVLREY